MQTMPMIQIPGVNFQGRRLFCQIMPGDNPKLLGEFMANLLKDLMTAKLKDNDLKAKQMAPKIVTPN